MLVFIFTKIVISSVFENLDSCKFKYFRKGQLNTNYFITLRNQNNFEFVFNVTKKKEIEL